MFSVLKAACSLALAAAGAVYAQQPALEDPTRPYAPPPAAAARSSEAPRYRLSAVVVSAERRIAVINGGVYREGERVDGAEIARIEPQRVHLRRGAERWVVRLLPQGGADSQDEGETS